MKGTSPLPAPISTFWGNGVAPPQKAAGSPTEFTIVINAWADDPLHTEERLWDLFIHQQPVDLDQGFIKVLFKAQFYCTFERLTQHYLSPFLFIASFQPSSPVVRYP